MRFCLPPRRTCLDLTFQIGTWLDYTIHVLKMTETNRKTLSAGRQWFLSALAEEQVAGQCFFLSRQWLSKWREAETIECILKFIWMNSPLSIPVAVIRRYQHRSRSHVCFVCRVFPLFLFASNVQVFSILSIYEPNNLTSILCIYYLYCSNGAGTMKDVNGFDIQNSKLRPILQPGTCINHQGILNSSLNPLLSFPLLPTIQH